MKKDMYHGIDRSELCLLRALLCEKTNDTATLGYNTRRRSWIVGYFSDQSENSAPGTAVYRHAEIAAIDVKKFVEELN